MLSQLTDFLAPGPTGAQQDPVDFSGLDFSEVDVSEMSAELSLEEKAVSNGQNGVPSPDATQLDGPQEEIRAALKGRIGRVMAGYERRIKGLNSEIQSCKIEDKIGRLQSAGRELGNGLSDLRSRLAPKIEEARSRVESAEEELSRFKSERGIQREPEYPSTPVLQVGLLAIVCVLEALVNGFFFRQGMEEGIVGGAFIALLLAGVDVFVVFWAARSSVWSCYGHDLTRKIIGGVATVFALGWALFYNLLTAHVREYLQADLLMEEAMQQALDRFLAMPFGIEQADSLVLIILGVVFSVSAYYAGATWEEVIPRYGAMDRKLEARKEDLRFWREKYREEAARLRDDKIEDVDRILGEAEDKTKQLEELISVKSALLEVVSECVDHYRSSFKALVKRYRDMNQRHRSAPPPSYFDEDPEIEFTEVQDYSTERERGVLARQKEEVAKKKKRMPDIKDQINEKYKNEIEEWRE